MFCFPIISTQFANRTHTNLSTSKATTGDSEGGDELKLGSSSLYKIPYYTFGIVADLFHLSYYVGVRLRLHGTAAGNGTKYPESG